MSKRDIHRNVAKVLASGFRDIRLLITQGKHFTLAKLTIEGNLFRTSSVFNVRPTALVDGSINNIRATT